MKVKDQEVWSVSTYGSQSLTPIATASHYLNVRFQMKEVFQRVKKEGVAVG
jgi:hypothetical protein